MIMITIMIMIIDMNMIMILQVVTFAIYAYFSLSLVAEQVLRFSIILVHKISITSQLYLLHHTNHANQIKLTILICLHLKMSLLKQQHSHDSI